MSKKYKIKYTELSDNKSKTKDKRIKKDINILQEQYDVVVNGKNITINIDGNIHLFIIPDNYPFTAPTYKINDERINIEWYPGTSLNDIINTHKLRNSAIIPRQDVRAQLGRQYDERTVASRQEDIRARQYDERTIVPRQEDVRARHYDERIVVPRQEEVRARLGRQYDERTVLPRQQTLGERTFVPKAELERKHTMDIIDDFEKMDITDELEKEFILFITAAYYFSSSGSIYPKYIYLINNIKNKIYNAGYNKIKIYYFDEFYQNNKRTTDLTNYEGLYASLGEEEFEINNRYLTYEDLRPYENQNNFLLIDCAHITFYKRARIREHDNFKVIVNIAQYENRDEIKSLLINSIYPTYLPDITDDFVKNFEFIRIENDIIKTFTWCIIDKMLKMDLKDDGIKTTVINYNKEEYGVDYSFYILLKIYSTNIINSLIWS